MSRETSNPPRVFAAPVMGVTEQESKLNNYNLQYVVQTAPIESRQ